MNILLEASHRLCCVCGAVICFFGSQYILSGSDDFNLYMWRIPTDPEAGNQNTLRSSISNVVACVHVVNLQ